MASYRQRRRRRLAKHQDNLCFFCDAPMLFVPEDISENNHPLEASDDHFVPRSQGGRGTLSNLVIAHRDCNTRHSNVLKDAEYEEKLIQLNIRRGLSDDDKNEVEPFGSIDTFTDATPASIALFSRLNSLPPEHINSSRKIITRLFTHFHFALKQFQAMPDKQFRYRLFRTWLTAFLEDREAAIDIVQHNVDDEGFVVYQYLQNIFSTYGKRKLLNGEKDNGD